MKFIKIMLLLFILAVLNNCTLFKKQIAKPVVVVIEDTVFNVTLNAQVPYPKYLNHVTTQQYARLFLKGFKSEAAITKNISLKYNASEADFIVKISSVTMKETSRLEKVNDPKSPYNGQEMELNTVECIAVMEITDVKNKTKKLNNCSNTKTRSEQITNNRNLDDLINGTNKDKRYRTKLLDENICSNLSQDVGRRIWTPITRRIAGDLK